MQGFLWSEAAVVADAEVEVDYSNNLGSIFYSFTIYLNVKTMIPTRDFSSITRRHQRSHFQFYVCFIYVYMIYTSIPTQSVSV